MRKADYIRLYYPYGRWVTEDGTEVLFNRDYHPIWRKDKTGLVGLARKDWWVPGIIKAEYYYNDNDPPHGPSNLKRTKEAQKRCLDALEKFGVTDALREQTPSL